jgi:hypothetical protein
MHGVVVPPHAFEPLGLLPHPFCWFGLEPTLFDAPSRPKRADMEWTAHSFLSIIGAPREVRALLGVSWGFVIDGDEISLKPVTPLPPTKWNEHLPLLRDQHPSWRFTPGYHDR